MYRVGLVITNLVGGGAERFVLNIAHMFLRYGIDVDIILLENRIDYPVENLNIHILMEKKPSRGLLKQKQNKVITRLLEKKILELESQKGTFDCILSNLPATDRLVKHMKIERNIWYIMHTAYSFEVEEFRRKKYYLRAWRRKKLYRQIYQGQKLICVSEGICKDIERIHIMPKQKKTIYNPFYFRYIREQAEKHANDIPDEPFIIHVGAFRKEKRHEVLLEAYRRLYTPPKLLLFCSHSEELSRMITAFDLQEKVEIFGFRQNPYPYIKHANLLVLSSEREGLPTVLIEGLILNTPVVSTDCVSGPREILTGELKHFLANVNDSADLAVKMEEALEAYPEITYDMIAKFDERSVFKEYLKIIEGNVEGSI